LFEQKRVFLDPLVALPSEPCVDLAAHLPFLTWETPACIEETCCDSLWESPRLVRSRGDAILSTGESTILALKPFVTFDHARAETATADVKPNIGKIGSENKHIFSHTPLQTLDRPKTTSSPTFRNED